MRVNIYAEEITDRVEIFEKETPDGVFTALRFYLELPATVNFYGQSVNVAGPFIHRPGDDDSSAVTFWGKKDLRALLVKAIGLLDHHHASKKDDAALLIAQERKRQIEVEGYTLAEDDTRTNGSLYRAGRCYLNHGHVNYGVPNEWPFVGRLWKPKDHLRNLVRAGALFMAEKERLERINDNHYSGHCDEGINLAIAGINNLQDQERGISGRATAGDSPPKETSQRDKLKRQLKAAELISGDGSWVSGSTDSFLDIVSK